LDFDAKTNQDLLLSALIVPMPEKVRVEAWRAFSLANIA
jgi:hypothetical protein